MDAFSLSLIYGVQGIEKKDKIFISLIVGIFHFIMPQIGLLLGELILNKIPLKHSIIVGIILIIISVEMIISSIKEEEKTFLLSIIGYLIFGLSVSIDSLTTGIGLSAITNNYILASVIFSLTSFLFTIVGLNIGNFLNIKYGKISTIIGGIILLLVGIFYIIN